MRYKAYIKDGQVVAVAKINRDSDEGGAVVGVTGRGGRGADEVDIDENIVKAIQDKRSREKIEDFEFRANAVRLKRKDKGKDDEIQRDLPEVPGQ